MTSNGAFEYRRSLSDGPRNTESQQDGIPADDGMRALREKLHEVRLLAISTEEKARRMHTLMTTQYAKHVADSTTQPQEPTKMDVLEEEKNGWEVVSTGDQYKLRPGDTDATISPLPSRPFGNESALDIDDGSDSDDGPALGCRHYKRNVKIQCFDCEQWYNCRHCHDAASDLPFAHSLNRKKTRNMLCMLCKTPQPASECCIKCGEYGAWYYCSKCKLWDNDTNKRIYHCDDCGLCRIGEGLGKDFVHCRRCNVCISIGTSNSHPCIERATDSDCPLCLTYLFESQMPVVSLPCGHYMHGECYKDLMAVTYKCPVCNKSAVNMELQWRKLDDEIEAQPMPDEDEDLNNLLPHVDGATPLTENAPPVRHGPRVVWIGCNDCGARSSSAFHWLGLKCQYCGGYNTNQMAPPAGRETEAERLLRQQAQHRHHDFTGEFVLRDVGIGREDTILEEPNGRVDSAIDASSPPHSPGRPATLRRASDAHSPSRRYFVQAEEQRRSSFTAPRFTAPSMPSLPNLPNLPNLPRMPELPNLPRMPNLPNLPNLPRMPDFPNLPRMPQMPNMSGIELSRFSPYEMAAVLSRSLSPMRLARESGQAPQRRGSGLSWRNSAPPDAYRDPRAQRPIETVDDAALLAAAAEHPPLRRVQTGPSEKLERHVESPDGRDEDDLFSELIGHP